MPDSKKELLSKISRGYSTTDSTRSLTQDPSLNPKESSHTLSPKESSSHTLRTLNFVKYKDFVPTSNGEKSEPFIKLVQHLNQWLKDNTDMKVHGCETVTWIGEKEVKDGENMAHFRNMAEGGITQITRGLRCWISPNPASHTQQVTYFDCTPSTNDRTQHLVSKINKKLRTKNIKGEILSLESLPVPVIKNHLHSSSTKWRENADDDITMAYIIRVFINKTNDHFKMQIGIQDFVPLSFSNDCYENFENLMQRCNEWLRTQPHNHVLNMQSIFVQKEQDPANELGFQSLYVTPGAGNFTPIEILRILRVAFVIHPHVEKLTVLEVDSTPLVESSVFYETFIPALIRRRHKDEFEETSKTYERVTNFLRTTDLRLVNIETVLNPIGMYVRSDEANFQENQDQVGFIFTFRLYLTNRSRPELKDLLKKWTADGSKKLSPSDKNDGGHRPIFLRNVVGGQFKYRWLALAISAFTCMAIIVTVSVVYSNR